MHSIFTKKFITLNFPAVCKDITRGEWLPTFSVWTEVFQATNCTKIKLSRQTDFTISSMKSTKLCYCKYHPSLEQRYKAVNDYFQNYEITNFIMQFVSYDDWSTLLIQTLIIDRYLSNFFLICFIVFLLYCLIHEGVFKWHWSAFLDKFPLVCNLPT